jgi:mono/diheme cytochrome c family protein
MKLLLIILFLLALLLVSVFGVTSYKSDQSTKTTEIFKDRCSRCHGLDGKGQTEQGARYHVPDFTSDSWPKPGVTDKELAATIKDGREEMPPFGPKLTDEEIKDLVMYVRSFKKPAEKR